MKTSAKIKIIQYRNGSFSETSDDVASEKKLKLLSDGREILSLMCTPTMVKELVVGFSLSEGLLEQGRPEQQTVWCSERMEIFWKDEEIEVHLPVTVPETAATLTSGCAKGVTFMTDQEMFEVRDEVKINIHSIFELYGEFQKKSELFKMTGGVHSAALCDKNGIFVFAEDIGRHNAVDKVIGYAFLENIPVKGKILLLSGRISSEIVNKAVRAGVPLLISRSAPTDMAIEIAQRFGITLVGFLRGQKLNIYSSAERINS